jgi:peptide/nickel transport system permease protein
MRFLLRRFGFYLIAGWASLTLNFVLPRLMPGDPATALFARLKGQLQPEAMAALRVAFGLSDKPLLAQYVEYLQHTFRGELGTSVTYFPASVGSVISTGLGWTLFLAGSALILSFVLGSLLGTLAAWRRGGWLDGVLTPTLALLGAFPYFWLAMGALYLFGFVLGWFPLRHAYSSDVVPGLNLAFIASVLRHAVLPALTLVLATIGGWMLGMRNTLVSVLGEDYVAFARAKGLAPTRVALRYGARNALLPSVTSFGMALGFAVSGSLLTEVVFSYPGQGFLLVQAVRNQDYALMQGVFLTLTLAVLGINLLVDLVCVGLDPRIRAEGAR